jgi:ABC-type lipoprotein release transport system permease subunit
VIAISLTFLSVADLLLLHVRERQREIGLLQAVGWRPAWVQRLFVQEGVTLALLGTIPGVLVAQWILHTQHATQSLVPAPVVDLGAAFLMVLVAACAAIPALRALSRMHVADVLRSE